MAILNLTTGIVFLKSWSGTVTGGTMLLADGSAAAPSLSYVTASTTGLYNAGGNMASSSGGSIQWLQAADIFRLKSSVAFGWSSGDPSLSVSDVILVRDAANTLALKNGANAQTLRVYSNATQYAAFISNASANLQIQSSAGLISIEPNSLGSVWQFDASGNFKDMGTHSITAGSSIKSTGATAGIGYGTGAGGAVTQATSRTTGVTLNTVTGDITLFSAAGSATAASFTVTNSTVAVTDNILINQKSGTDLYTILITNVAAGSFKVTFFTTGGTTTEQPVFHFSVVKGVNS